MVTLTFTPAQRMRAWRARCLLESGVVERSQINAVVAGANKAICDDGRISGGDRVDKYRAMALLFAKDPVVGDFLGGTFRATLAEDMTAQLSKIDEDLRIEIIAIARLALETAAEKIAVSVARRSRSGSGDRHGLNSIEQWSRDNDAPAVFVAGLRSSVSDALFAELTADEEELALAELDNAAAAVEEALAVASAAVLAVLPGDDLASVEEGHEVQRPLAVSMFRTAMAALVLGRLGRATDSDDRVTTEVEVPPNLANDTMTVAGGGSPLDDGGLAVNSDGRPITASGDQVKGTRFAQGDTTSQHLETEFGLLAVDYFRHSGQPDGNPLHVNVDGSRLDEISIRPGGKGCRCWEETIYEEQAL